jgi:hypothetical protein
VFLQISKSLLNSLITHSVVSIEIIVNRLCGVLTILTVIVNGQRNKVVLDIVNKETTPYTVFAVSGQIYKSDDYTQVVRNVSWLCDILEENIHFCFFS